MSLLTQRAKDLRTKMLKRLEDLLAQKLVQEESLKKLYQSGKNQTKHIEDEFELLVTTLEDRKATLKEDYEEICKTEIGRIDGDLVKTSEVLSNMNKAVEEVADYISTLGTISER